ncbi:hypothetical protein Lal_00024572 [Lupinus albus]|nr:hypothetical protein Lal_00024572 [Lupinus albus]
MDATQEKGEERAFTQIYLYPINVLWSNATMQYKKDFIFMRSLTMYNQVMFDIMLCPEKNIASSYSRKENSKSKRQIDHILLTYFIEHKMPDMKKWTINNLSQRLELELYNAHTMEQRIQQEQLSLSSEPAIIQTEHKNPMHYKEDKRSGLFYPGDGVVDSLLAP